MPTKRIALRERTVAGRLRSRTSLTAAVWLCLAAVLAGGCNGQAPGTRLHSLDGEEVKVAGRVLAVNYWAEWCAPCREEIPELNAFQQQYPQRVLVLGINFDQLPAEQVRTQAKKFGIAFPVLAGEPPARWGQPRPQVLPTTLLIDAEGRWRETLVGPQTVASLEQALARVELAPKQQAK